MRGNVVALIGGMGVSSGIIIKFFYGFVVWFKNVLYFCSEEIKNYENYNKRLSDLFKSKTLKQAQRKFKRLQGEIKSMPEEIQKFIKSISKDFETTINHIINPEIPSTNNLLEGFYKVTFLGRIKRIYRTDKGIKIRLKLSQMRWTKRNVLKIK